MHQRLLGLLGGLAVATAAVLVACSPQNAGLISVTHVTPPSFVRVLNGAPDLDPVTVTVASVATAAPSSSPSTAPTATPTASPSASPSPLAYGSMTAFGTYTGDAGVTIAVSRPGGASPVLTCQTSSIGEGLHITVVIAGRTTSAVGTPTGLQCDVFQESPPAIPSAGALIGMHHAAPAFAAKNAAADAKVNFGIFVPSSPVSYKAPLSFAAYTAPAELSDVAIGTAVYSTISAATSSPGIGVYASNGTTTPSSSSTPPPTGDIFATVLPSQATTGAAVASPAADTANVLPFTSTTGTSYLFDTYLIDSTKTASGAVLVGTLD